MTTVALRDGVIAAERLITNRDIVVGLQKKLFVATGPGGSYVHASVGECGHDDAVGKWIGDGMNPTEIPDIGEHGHAVVVWCGGLRTLTCGLMYEAGEAPFHAWGNGRVIALGAMAAGASAEEAVEIACRFDVYSRGPIDVIKIADL
jgi:hypothetical protein